jgi:hypothetical protein
MIMRRERPSLPPKPRAAATARAPMFFRVFRWRLRISSEPVAAAFAENSAVRRNGDGLTQGCGPSAPPILPIRIQGFRLVHAISNNFHLSPSNLIRISSTVSLASARKIVTNAYD